jgi:hypothetical protein
VGERGDGYEQMFDDFFADGFDDVDILEAGDLSYYEMIDKFLEHEGQGELQFVNYDFFIDMPASVVPEDEDTDVSSGDLCGDSVHCEEEEKMKVYEYLSFIAKYHTSGDRVLCYGAAACPTILEISFNLGIPLICVDDYPMKRYSPFEYYSFEEFYYKLDSGDIACDGFFMVKHFSNKTNLVNYDYFLDVLSKLSHIYYSVGRHLSVDGGGKRVQGSKLSRILFSPFEDYAFREEGYLKDHCVVVPYFDFRPLYNKLPVIDSLCGSQDEDEACLCSHCDRGRSVLLRVARSFLKVVSELDLRLTDEQISRGKRDYMRFIQTPEHACVTFRSTQLYADENYVWNPDVEPYYLVDGFNHRCFFVRCVSTSPMGRAIIPKLGVTNSHYQGSLKVIARFHSDNIKLRYYRKSDSKFSPYFPAERLELPMVAVNSSTGNTSFFRIDGRKEVIFISPGASVTLPCVNCKHSSNVFGLSLAEALSIRRPASSICDYCGLMSSYTYS